ncbi:DNA polymerase III subunit gamma/tau [bacterium]|nr:DNA polymerase III subunit gamma/tau [Candidatus Elulimicrobium humile]
MPALYRTYRPQNFQQVIGQEIVKNTLQNAILNNRTVHSYLFSGPRGTGKTTMARIFAKAINCLNRAQNSAEPCNKCANCKAINENSFIDLIEIDAASNRGIDEIRNLKEAIRFAPSQKNGHKIYIIDEAHMLTKDACNALLKTLEEPPQNIIFILATTDAHKMLPTILSRVQKFDFKPLAYSELKQKILFITEQEQIKIDEQVVNQIILQAMGGARDAESILGKLISSGNKDITLEFASNILGYNSYFEAYTLLELLANNNLYEAIRHIHKLYNSGYAMEQFILNLLAISHNIFLAQINLNLIDKSTLLDDEYTRLEALSQKLKKEKIINLIQNLELIKSQTNSAYLPYLPLEIALAEIWDVDDTPQINTQPTKLAELEFTPKLKSKPTATITPEKPKEPIIEPAKVKTGTAIQPKTSKSNPTTPNPSPPTVQEKQEAGDIYTIYKIYPNINKSLTKTNKSLAIIFAQTQPVTLTNKKLTVAVESDFYKSRLEKHSKIILDAIQEQANSIESITFIAQKVYPNTMPASDFNSEDNTEPKNLSDTIADIFKDSL